MVTILMVGELNSHALLQIISSAKLQIARKGTKQPTVQHLSTVVFFPRKTSCPFPYEMTN